MRLFPAEHVHYLLLLPVSWFQCLSALQLRIVDSASRIINKKGGKKVGEPACEVCSTWRLHFSSPLPRTLACDNSMSMSLPSASVILVHCAPPHSCHGREASQRPHVTLQLPLSFQGSPLLCICLTTFSPYFPPPMSLLFNHSQRKQLMLHV